MNMTVDTGCDALFNNYGLRQLSIVRGEGAYLYDEEGRRYLDFTSGIAVCNLGHAHPGLSAVIAKQAATLLHTSNLFFVPGQAELASKLAKLADLGEPTKAMFVNSGTEANEAALKLARRYQTVAKHRPEKTRLLSLPNAFHGRTMGALSVTPKVAYHEGFAPLVPNCVTPATLADVISAVDDSVAACIVEVIQGEGGVHPFDKAFLAALADKLRVHEALLIVDEVQTGVGRTGTFFAYEQLGLQPDIITMAKGLGNGMPVGAVIARAGVADAFTPGAHGSTFGGNPLAMAVANYVVDTVSAPAFLDNVQRLGSALERILRNSVKGVSGRGLMWGFDVADAGQFLSRAREAGLLVTQCSSTRVRILPPLTIDNKIVAEFAELLSKVLD